MKTVSGKVISSNSVSLLKAAKYLSEFAASDNEASPAFVAYLRRTSASFNELVKMHKEYKIPLGLVRVKGEDHSEGVVTQGTAQSVELGAGYMEVQSSREGKKRNGGYRQSDLSVDESSKDMRDEVEERRNVVTCEMEKDAQSSGGIIEGAVVDVGGGRKISKKKKRHGNETVAVFDKDQGNVDCDIVGVEVKNEMGSLDGNEELTNRRKSKRDKHGKKSGNADLEIRNEGKRVDGDGDVAEPVQNDDVMQKKHRKKNKPSGDGDVEIKKEVQQADDVAQCMQYKGDTQKKHKESKVKGEQQNSSTNNDENKDNGNLKNKMQKEREHGSINEMVTVDGSEDVKKKREKHVKGISDGPLEAGKEVYDDGVGDVVHAVQNDDKQRKKHKNKTNTRKGDGIVKGEVMVKKEPTEAANEKASKKRKHDEVAGGGLDGSPQEVKTKKKKNRH